MHNLIKNFSAKKIVICILAMLLSAFLLLAGLALADTLTKQSNSSEVVGAANLIVKQGATTLTDGAAVNKSNGNVIITATDTTSPVLIHSANLTKGETVGRVLNDYDLISRISESYLTRSTNTFTVNKTDNNTIYSFKVQRFTNSLSYIETDFITGELGEHTVDLPITSDVGYVKVAFSGSNYDAQILIDVRDLPRDTYKLTFKLTNLSSTSGSFELPTGALSLLNDYDLLNKMAGVSSLTQVGNKFTTIGNNANTAFTIRAYDDSFEVISDVFSVSSAGMYAANIPLTEKAAYLQLLFEGKNDPDLLINVADIPKGNYKLAINIPEFSSATASFEFPTSIGGINSITLTEEGRYAYYIEDSAGTKSSTYTLTIDDGAAPVLTAKTNNGTVMGNGSNLCGTVTLSAKDTYSNSTIYWRNTTTTTTWSSKNSSSPNTEYSTPTISGQGWYEYYAIDAAGNRSNTRTFLIDCTVPVITVSSRDADGNNISLSSGATTENYFIATASDPKFPNGTDAAGINYLRYQKPGSSEWINAESGNRIRIGYSDPKGVYTIKAMDNAGCNSTYTINFQPDLWINDESLREEPTIEGKICHVKNEKQLAWIAWQNRMNGWTYSGCTISIEADLDMSAHYWAPLAGVSGVIINGNNHVIYGLKTTFGNGYVNKSTPAQDDLLIGYAGFVGWSNIVHYRNLRFANLVSRAEFGVGSIAGSFNDGSTMENCFVDGKVIGEDLAGGLIGSCYSGSYVKNSGFVGIVESKRTGYIGSLVGYWTSYSPVNMENCFAYANLVLPTSVSLVKTNGVIIGLYTPSANDSIKSVISYSKVSDSSQYELKSYYGSTFDPSLWFQEPKLCGGMPLLRQFYWLGSTYRQKAIDLNGYTKYTY